MASGPPPVFPPNPPLDPNDPNSPFSPHSLYEQAQKIADHNNATALANYNAAIDGYQFNVSVGRPPAGPPPEPPMQWFANPDGSVAQSNTPLVAPHAIKLPDPEPPEGTFDIGAQLDAVHFAQGPRDRTIAGTTKILPNGVTVRKIGFFFGGGSNPKYGGWYEIVGTPTGVAPQPASANSGNLLSAFGSGFK